MVCTGLCEALWCVGCDVAWRAQGCVELCGVGWGAVWYVVCGVLWCGVGCRMGCDVWCIVVWCVGR